MARQRNLLLEQPKRKGIALKAVGRINLLKKTAERIRLPKKEDGRIRLLKKEDGKNQLSLPIGWRGLGFFLNTPFGEQKTILHVRVDHVQHRPQGVQACTSLQESGTVLLASANKLIFA